MPALAVASRNDSRVDVEPRAQGVEDRGLPDAAVSNENRDLAGQQIPEVRHAFAGPGRARQNRQAQLAVGLQSRQLLPTLVGIGHQIDLVDADRCRCSAPGDGDQIAVDQRWPERGIAQRLDVYCDVDVGRDHPLLAVILRIGARQHRPPGKDAADTKRVLTVGCESDLVAHGDAGLLVPGEVRGPAHNPRLRTTPEPGRLPTRWRPPGHGAQWRLARFRSALLESARSPGVSVVAAALGRRRQAIHPRPGLPSRQGGRALGRPCPASDAAD